MKTNLLQIASLIAIFQAILMAIFSLRNTKGSKTSNVILASMLVLFSIITACTLFLSAIFLKFYSQYHKVLFVVGNLAFLIGPLLYFYIKSLLDPNYSVQRKDWLHALPFPAAVICSFIILQHYNNFYILNYRGRLFFSAAILVQSLAYIIASFKILHSNGLTFKSFLSYIDNSKLAWMRFFISGYIVLWLIQFQLFVGWDVLGKPLWCPYTTSLYLLTAFLFFNGMVYIGLKKPETFHQSQKYQSSVLKKPDKERYQEKLTSLMSSEKPYLDSSLTLTEIAQKLEIHPIYVSQIINETLQQNFRDFVNKYRIEESKRLLTQKDQHLNILGIALDAGFNSKSAFNRAFKRHTGITPKEFKKQAS